MIITDADRAEHGESCVTGASSDAAPDCEIRITWRVPEGHLPHPRETFEQRPEMWDALLRAQGIHQENRKNAWGPGSDQAVTVEAVHVRWPGEPWHEVTSSR